MALELDRTLIEDLLPRRSTDSVSHYTRLTNLPNMLGQDGWNSAWATPVQFLNDRAELALGLKTLRDVSEEFDMDRVTKAIIEVLISSEGSLGNDSFQISLSGAVDELGQWRGYASNGFGCGMVISPTDIINKGDLSGWVLYDSVEQRLFAKRVLESVQKRLDTESVSRYLIAAASFIKHPGFKQEQEYRVLKFADKKDIKFRAIGERIAPYTDLLSSGQGLKLQKIIFGPGWRLGETADDQLVQHHAVQGVRRLLEFHGLKNSVTVEASSIPYDPR